jgi:hypothetical protein
MWDLDWNSPEQVDQGSTHAATIASGVRLDVSHHDADAELSIAMLPDLYLGVPVRCPLPHLHARRLVIPSQYCIDRRKQVNFPSTGTVVLPDDPHYTKQRGTLTPEGYWIPLLAQKGYRVFNNQIRTMLVHGARKTGKSLNIGNRFMRHGYEVNGAIVGIICKTLKNAKQGVWRDLTEFIVPGWVDAGACKMTLQPTMEPDTKMIKFRISNAWGTESEFQLHSLPNVSNVESAFKGTRFSGVWISEADQFESRDVMDILGDQLRMVQIPWEQHMMILDCNPPEEGEDHWLYHPFFIEPNENPALRAVRTQIHFELDDNPFLPHQEREELEQKYAYDPVKYARFVKGQWVKDSTKGHFDGYFMPQLHIVGDVSSPDENDHSVLLPDESVTMLLGGWDIGEVNHAFGLWVPRLNANGDTAYDKIDELVYVGSEVGLYDFTIQALEKQEFWSDYIEKKFGRKPVFRHWGDSSMFNFRANAARTDAALIYSASGGKMLVRSVTKGDGSVSARIGLTKRLLREGRLYVSASCPNAVDWLRYLKRGTTKTDVIQPGSPFKHSFDADSYIWWEEEPIDMTQRANRPRAGKPAPVLSL